MGAFEREGVRFPAVSDASDSAEAAEQSFFDFKCPHCGGQVSFPASAVGQAGECTNCGETFIVPAAGHEKGARLPIPIATGRLTLRRFQLADCDDVAAFMSDEELFTCADGSPMNEQQVHEWIASAAKIRFTTPDKEFPLAIEHNDTRRVIGFANLAVEQVWRKLATISITIGRKQQRQGFGTEALKAALQFCFAVRLHRVTASCDSRNEAAARMCEKAGMKFEAHFREDRAEGFGWADTVWFGILDRESPGAGGQGG